MTYRTLITNLFRPTVSVARGHPILPRIRCRSPALDQFHHCLRAAKGREVLVSQFVTQRFQRLPGFERDRTLQSKSKAVEVTETGRIERVLQIHAERHEIQEHLDMTLRLN